MIFPRFGTRLQGKPSQEASFAALSYRKLSREVFTNVLVQKVSKNRTTRRVSRGYVERSAGRVEKFRHRARLDRENRGSEATVDPSHQSKLALDLC